MELETMKFIVKQSIVTKNLCRFADDQTRFNRNVVKAINRYRKGSLYLCAATALLLLVENNSQKRIEKLEKEVARLKTKEYDGNCCVDPTEDCFDVKLP